MVEKSRAVFHALKDNATKLKLDNVILRNEDGLNFASRLNEQFDVIFLDPPFQSEYLPKLLPMLAKQLSTEGMLYVESGSAFDAGEDWQIYKQGRASAVHYQLLQYGHHD